MFEKLAGASPASAPKVAAYNQVRESADPGSAPEVSAQTDAAKPPEPASEFASPAGSVTLVRIAKPSFGKGHRGNE